ncbi:MAG TPA: DUF3990 domain-containing protein [Chroococcales cyanobacterium]
MSWNNGPMRVFHGTTKRHLSSIKSGISLTATKSLTDFGNGFYTTTNKTQAQRWALRKAKREYFEGHRLDLDPVVLEFSIDRNLIAKLESLCFVSGHYQSSDYWDLVIHCRSNKFATNRLALGWYDVVYGPVATRWDGPPKERRTRPSFDQISFHTKAGLSLLCLVRIFEVP